MHLVNEAVNNKVDVFVFTSSIAVYGTNQAILSLSQSAHGCGSNADYTVRSRTAMRIAVHRRVPFRFVCLRGCDLWHCRTGVNAEAVVASTIVRL
jgi:UDP-glucose 4-epimerase